MDFYNVGLLSQYLKEARVNGLPDKIVVVCQNKITGRDPGWESNSFFTNRVTNGIYSDTFHGFQITLPVKWNGMYFPDSIWISPRGIDPNTLGVGSGEDIDDLFLRITPPNILSNMKDIGASSFEDLRKRNAEETGCTISYKWRYYPKFDATMQCRCRRQLYSY